MVELELCWRCGLMMTGKRIDGKPVCNTCMLSDARANGGVLPYYGDLTPVYRKHDTPPPSTPPAKLRKRASPKPGEPKTLKEPTKAELRGIPPG